MERSKPGTTLKEYFPDRDKKATSVLCLCLQQFHQAEIPKKYNFLHLKELLAILDNNLDIPLDNLSKARQLRDDLLSSMDKVVLLHGD
jgi:streptomycin 6-kinase